MSSTCAASRLRRSTCTAPTPRSSSSRTTADCARPSWPSPASARPRRRIWPRPGAPGRSSSPLRSSEASAPRSARPTSSSSRPSARWEICPTPARSVCFSFAATNEINRGASPMSWVRPARRVSSCCFAACCRRKAPACAASRCKDGAVPPASGEPLRASFCSFRAH